MEQISQRTQAEDDDDRSDPGLNATPATPYSGQKKLHRRPREAIVRALNKKYDIDLYGLPGLL